MADLFMAGIDEAEAIESTADGFAEGVAPSAGAVARTSLPGRADRALAPRPGASW